MGREELRVDRREKGREGRVEELTVGGKKGGRVGGV